MAQFNYNGFSESSGIYKIINTYSGRIYIGSTKRFRERWKDGHYRSLLKGKLQNKFFQADFNKCKQELGHDDFLQFHVLEVIENSTKTDRNPREDFWIAEYKKKGYILYNHVEINTGDEHVYSHTPNITRQKKSRILKDRWINDKKYAKRMRGQSHPCFGKQRSQEVKDKISHANTGNKAFLGKKHTDKTKALKSQKAKGKIISLHQRKLQSIKMKGRKLSEEHKAKLRKYTPRAKTYDIKLLAPSGLVFGPITNMAKFCTEHQLCRSDMCLMAQGKKTSHKGWTLLK